MLARMSGQHPSLATEIQVAEFHVCEQSPAPHTVAVRRRHTFLLNVFAEVFEQVVLGAVDQILGQQVDEMDSQR